jgi:hypothetical protein
MKSLLVLFVSTLFLLTTLDASAQKRKSYKPKTVHVRSYTTKKGKHVRSYKRSKPSSLILYTEAIISRRKAA